MQIFSTTFIAIILVSAFAQGAGAPSSNEIIYVVAKSGVVPSAGVSRANGNASQANGAAGPMQVEEPGSAAKGADKITDPHSRAKGLSEQQKNAFRQRKEKMQEMMALIKAKRSALQNAKPEERAALANELHNLILEKNPEIALPTTGSPGYDPAGTSTTTSARVLTEDKPSELPMDKSGEKPSSSLESPGTSASGSRPAVPQDPPATVPSGKAATGTSGDFRPNPGSSGAPSAHEGNWENAHRRGEERPFPKVERNREFPKRSVTRDDDNN